MTKMLDDYGHLKEEFYTMRSDFSVCIKELSEAIHILKEIQSMWDVLPSEIIDKVDDFLIVQTLPLRDSLKPSTHEREACSTQQPRDKR